MDRNRSLESSLNQPHFSLSLVDSLKGQIKNVADYRAVLYMLPTVDITYRCVPEGPLPRAKCCILTLLNTQADCSVPLQLEFV